MNYLELPKKEGINLLKTPPETLPKTSEANAFALPNLSHFVNAKEFVKVKETAIITNIKDKNSNFNRAKKPNTDHKVGIMYNKIQKTFESIGFIYLSGLAVSKTQILPPFSSVSFHQRKPTNNLPLIFLTFQKSAANNSITVMKKKIKFEVNKVPRMYVRGAPTLKAMKNNSAIGCEDSLSLWYNVREPLLA